MLLKSSAVKQSDELRDARSIGRAWQKRSGSSDDVALLWGLLKNCRRFSWLDGLIRQLGSTPKHWKGQLEQLHQQEQLIFLTKEGEGGLLKQALERAKLNSHPWLTAEGLLDTVVKEPPEHLVPVLERWQLSPEAYKEAKQALYGKRWKRRLFFSAKEAVEVVGLMLVFLIVMREWIGEPRLIPSESMVPTLQVDDRVFIEKVSRWWRPYDRGDVIVFYPPSSQVYNDPFSWFLRTTGISGFIYDKEDNIDIAYIKRLIALPGDTVEVRPGVGVLINDKLLQEPYKAEISQTCTQEYPLLQCGPMTVPEDHYFFLGDNRNASQDSRYWGFLPKERVIGRAALIMWPPWHWQWLGQIPKPKESL